MSTNKSKRTKTKDVRLSNPIATFFHCEKCCEEECEYPGDKSVGYAEFQRDSGNERSDLMQCWTVEAFTLP
jgi:hypothetical protein